MCFTLNCASCIISNSIYICFTVYGGKARKLCQRTTNANYGFAEGKLCLLTIQNIAFSFRAFMLVFVFIVR